MDRTRRKPPQDWKLGSQFAFCSLFVLVGQVGLLLALDGSSRLLSDRLWFIESWPIVSILALLLLLHLSNSLVLDGFMALRSTLEGSFPGWLLKVRFLLAGLPLLGIYMLPAWEWVLASRPQWSQCRAVDSRKRSTPLSGRLLLLFCKSRTRWLRVSVYFFLGLLVLNLLILGTAVIWLASSRTGLLELASVQFFLQVSAFGTAMIYVGSQSGTRELSRTRGWLRFLPAFLFLCPWPFSGLGLMVIFLGEKKQAGRKSPLMEAAYAKWQTIGAPTREHGRYLKWWQISQSWRSKWFSARSPGRPAIVDRKLLTFYRLKTFLLAIDAAALSWGMMWTARRVLTLTPGLESALALLTTFSFWLVLLGFAVFAADRLWRLARRIAARTLERPPASRYFLLTQLAFFVGLYLGIVLAQENYDSFRRTLMWIGLAGVGISVAGGFPFLRRGRSAQKSIQSSFSRAAPFMLVIITGGMLEAEGAAARTALFIIGTAIGGFPLWGLVLTAVMSRWLLRPFQPSQILDHRLPLRTRATLAFLVLAAALPMGGLTLPVWMWLRRHCRAESGNWNLAADRESSFRKRGTRSTVQSPRPRTKGSADDLEPTVKVDRRPAPTVRKVGREYDPYLWLIQHLSAAQDWPRIFEMLEDRSFLANQATHFDSFRHSSQSLEGLILPALVRLEDWPRFLRYTLVAIHLRGLAESLMKEEIVRRLVKDGRVGLCLDLAAQLSRPAWRIYARSLVAEQLQETDIQSFGLVASTIDDLKVLSPPNNDEELRFQIHGIWAAAQHMGEALKDEFEKKIRTDAGWQAIGDLIWWSSAQGRLRRSGFADPAFWDFLARIQDSRHLSQHLPELMREHSSLEDSALILQCLDSLPQAETWRWPAQAALLGSLAKESPRKAWLLFQDLADKQPVPWSLDLIEWGKAFFAGLGRDQLDQLAAGIEDPEILSALRVTVYRESPDRQDRRTVWASIDVIPSQMRRIHWTLRFLSVPVAEGEDSLPTELRAVARELFALRYQLDVEDLHLFLESVSRILPLELVPLAEEVHLSLTKLDDLFFLVERSTSREYLEYLYQQSEMLVASIRGLTEVQGTRLLARLKTESAARLCELRQDLHYYEAARGLLPSTGPLRDELRLAVAEALSKGRVPRHLKPVCRAIRSKQHRLLTLLRHFPQDATSEGLLELGTLYETFTDIGPVEDELRGLGALLAKPGSPERVFHDDLSPIRKPESQIAALIRFARHVLSGSESGLEDRQVTVQMLGQAVGSLNSDAQLIAATPQLLEISRLVSRDAGVREFGAGIARLLALTTVPWPLRRGGLEGLLSQSAELLQGGSQNARQHARHCRLLASALSAIARHSEDSPQPEEAEKTAQPLPMAVAASKRLPETVAAYLESPGLSRLCQEWLSPLPAQVRQAVWNLIHPVIKPFSGPILPPDLGDMDGEALMREIERLERRPEAGPRRVETLAYVAAGLPGAPVSRLISLLPAGEERDSLCLRLIRHRWLDPRTARGLMDLFDERSMAREAECRLAIQEAETDSGWIRKLVALLHERSLDPADLGYEALILRLWKTRPEVSRKALAQTVLTILATHGYESALVVLRLWLHAHLSPTMGEGRPEKQRLLARAREAVRAAARLGSSSAI